MTMRRLYTPLPQLEKRTPFVASVAARAVVDDLSLWLGVPLPRRYAAGLAHRRARRCYAHSPSFRARIDRPGDRGRDKLYIYLRHWLAARLYTERPDLFRRLPDSYRTGAPLPPPPLTNDARLLAARALGG